MDNISLVCYPNISPSKYVIVINKKDKNRYSGDCGASRVDHLFPDAHRVTGILINIFIVLKLLSLNTPSLQAYTWTNCPVP